MNILGTGFREQPLPFLLGLAFISTTIETVEVPR